MSAAGPVRIRRRYVGVVSALALALASAEILALSAHSQDSTIAVTLNRMQADLGTDVKRIHSLTLRGERLAGFNGVTGQPMNVPAQMEARVLLPEHYRRTVTDPLLGTVTVTGFDRSLGLLEVTPRSRPQPPLPAEYADVERAYLARLLLGAIADVSDVMPLQIVRVSMVAGAPTMHIVGPGQFVGDLDLDSSYLPVRFRYMDQVRYPMPLTEQERIEGRTQGDFKVENAEVTIAFDKRVVISGVSFPLLIRRTARGLTFEELRLTTVEINPLLTEADFGRAVGAK